MNLITLFLPFLLSKFVSWYFPMDQKWYQSLEQSPMTPSNQLFGYFWIANYLLIGFGLGLPNPEWLIVNFMLSLLWSIVFSGQKNVRAGFWILLLMNFTLVMHLQKTNQWFLAPYLIWSLYALYLNAYIMKNNS